MLEVNGICASYGAVRALEGISLSLAEGAMACLLGANGAGKTTTLNCVSGVVPVTRGTIRCDGENITRWRIDRIVAHGIVQVPEGREIFPLLSVQDNLLLGAWLHLRKRDVSADFDRVFDYFPRLRERSGQLAGTLSGGEQQMLMIGRALMARPRYLLLDEPSLGLSPVLVQQLFAVISRMHSEGMGILLVEQNARMALSVSQYGYIIENGEVRLHGVASGLAENPEVRAAYLGA
jgi:branched-chain amino acid transport system ATP-binding protein